MKIKNLQTNIIFNLPKIEAQNLLEEYPNLYEKFSKTAKTKTKTTKPPTNPEYPQNTFLPLIWEEGG